MTTNWLNIPLSDAELVETVGAAVKARRDTATLVKEAFQREVRRKARAKLLGLLSTRLPPED